MPAVGAAPKAMPAIDEKSVKQFKQVRDDAAKEIALIRSQYREDPEAMKGTPDEFRYQDALDRYNRAAEVVNRFNNSILNGGQSQVQPNGAGALQTFLDLSQRFLDAGKAPVRNVVKSSEVKR